MSEPRDFADLLAQCGATVGGGAAVGAAIGLLVGTALKESAAFSRRARERGWADIEPVAYATRMAPLGGVMGLAALLFRWGGVH